MENSDKQEEMTPSDGLTPKERYDAKKQEKTNAKQAVDTKKVVVKKSKTTIIWAVVILAVLAGGYFSLRALNSLPFLPPSSQQNHVETVPESHILTTQIPTREQAHMLEHADGDGAPGVIIQYNCDDYECAPDLIENLTTLVEEFPDNVYLAPNRYDGKLILTKAGRSEVLDGFEEETIRNFIGN